eukprot:6786746-Prymnesium_polylepis.1
MASTRVFLANDGTFAFIARNGRVPLDPCSLPDSATVGLRDWAPFWVEKKRALSGTIPPLAYGL